MNDSQAIVVDHVSSGYGDHIVVKDIDITAEAGTFTTLLGPNGCGKSTLLKSITRLLTPVAGTVTYGATSLQDVSPKKLAQTVAMLPQHPFAPDGLSVVELVSRGRHPWRSPLRGLSATDRRIIAEAMEETEVSGLAERSIETLSGGQRQRVWMAMVLAQDTPVLLLDEPTTYLDPARAMEILSIAKRQAQAGKVVISVLHDLHLAGHFSDRVVLLKEGHVYADGSPADVMTVDAVKDVYDLRAEVWDDPASASPIIVPRGVYGHDQ
ncbi:ABC transporter ATP-binding protein [Corynebacterium pyruviciproducens]